MKIFQIFEHLVHIPSLAQYIRLDSKTLGKTLAWISSWAVWAQIEYGTCYSAQTAHKPIHTVSICTFTYHKKQGCV